MSKLSERQRLAITIGLSVLLAGGIVALILMDRDEIKQIEEEITTLEQRIAAANIEIAKIPPREDKVIVFRAVEKRELEILPTEQKIADFHSGISTFLASAGIGFDELPESKPEDSELAKGIRVTRNQIRGRLVKTEILPCFGFGHRHADLGINNTVADFMRKDIEVQRVRQVRTRLAVEISHLDEAKSGLGVVPVIQQDQFQPREDMRKMPFDLAPEITFPDIQHPVHRAEQVGAFELPRARFQVIEVALCVGQNRRISISIPGRQVQVRLTPGILMYAVGMGFGNGIDDEHTVVRRTGTHRTGWR